MSQEVKSVSRRNGREAALGNLTVRFDTYSVYVEGVLVDLGAKQFDLLRVMLDHVDRVLPYSTFATALWGTSDRRRLRNLNVLVHRLRRSLEGSRPYIIKTVRGRGYGLILDESAAKDGRLRGGLLMQQ